MNPDERAMRRALGFAERGRRRVEPNPVVGAVLLKDGEEVGAGWHACFGGAHAEIEALGEAGDRAAGATCYVTLEPCGHVGKTGACAEALASAGVSRVIYAASDPNPLTAGAGPRFLRSRGVEVVGGVLKAEARALNHRYLDHLESDLPWTIAKWAMSLDGKIADVRGGGKYITGVKARGLVHALRGAVDAVVIGVGTALADDPDLTCREGKVLRDAVRVVVDSRLRLAPDSVLARTAGEQPTWIAAGEHADRGRSRALESAGCRVLRVPVARDKRVDLRAAFSMFAREGLARVLLEGGGTLMASAFGAGVVHQVMAFVAPLLLGGGVAPTPIDGPGFRSIDRALRLDDVRVSGLGEDTLIEGFLPVA